jgi:hypothetical protein
MIADESSSRESVIVEGDLKCSQSRKKQSAAAHHLATTAKLSRWAPSGASITANKKLGISSVLRSGS